jgi:transposase InsO family protein
MRADIYPLQVLLAALAGWMNRHQQDVIAYLVEENRVLKEQLKGKRMRLTDDQRRRLAAKAKRLGRKALNRIATIVTPDTLMRWHRRLIALKWTFAAKRVGRPGLMKKIAELIVRMARENSSWGYCRIQGEIRALGHRVAPSTIAKVLRDNGMRPAPERPSSWRSFLKAHWDQIAGMDFFTTEVWTPRGLTTYYVLFLIELKTRRIHVAGITTNPDGAFMAQVARNLTDAVDGFLKGQRFVICDRDSCFTAQFRSILEDAGVKVIRTPRQAPNCNAYAERFVLSIKSECLGRLILFGESSLRRAVAEYVAHYHTERAHQGLGNERIEGAVVTADGEVRCRERLGGILKSYHPAA